MARNDRRDFFINFLNTLPAPVAAELIRKLTSDRRTLRGKKQEDLYKKHRFLQRRA